MQIFNLLLSFSPVIYILYWFLQIRKKSESINYDIKSGYKCYSCKKNIDSLDDRIKKLGKSIKSLEDLEKLNKLVCCKSCKRELKLNQLTKPLGFRYKLMHDIDRFLISDRYKSFIWISLSIIISCLILDLFLLREWRIFFYIGQLSQLIYWILLIRSYKLTTIKKPNQ